jgi:hypothetical protein
MSESMNRLKVLLGTLIAVLALVSCSRNEAAKQEPPNIETRTAAEFVQTLENNGLKINQNSAIDCDLFAGCKKRHHLYLETLDEWIELFEFDSEASAKAAFPGGTYSIMGNETKVALKQNLALFVYDQHSQWEDVWRVWKNF